MQKGRRACPTCAFRTSAELATEQALLCCWHITLLVLNRLCGACNFRKRLDVVAPTLPRHASLGRMAVILVPASMAALAGIGGVGYTFYLSRRRVVDALETRFGELLHDWAALCSIWRRIVVSWTQYE